MNDLLDIDFDTKTKNDPSLTAQTKGGHGSGFSQMGWVGSKVV